MNIEELTNKISSITEQMDELSLQKKELENEIENIKKDEKAKRKAEQDKEYTIIKDMINAYNKKYNTNLAIAECYEIKAEDYPSRGIDELFKIWGIV